VQPDVPAFTRSLHDLSRADFRWAAELIVERRKDPADDVRWWQATLAVDELIAGQHRSLEASAASRGAGGAVLAAARAAGLDPDDVDVVVVARRARQVARALVAGPAAHHHVRYLLAGWWVPAGSRA